LKENDFKAKKASKKCQKDYSLPRKNDPKTAA